MTMPTLTKAWELDINNVEVSDANTHDWHRKMMLACKNVMIGFSNNPWTVAGSSDASVGAMDSVDRWSSFGDLQWDDLTDPHSWIVLERVDGVQVCFDQNFQIANVTRMYIWMSASGSFTGGSSTARPTASDEVEITTDSEFWMGYQSGAPTTDCRYHFWHSTDGLVTRAVFYVTNVPRAIWRFERFQNPRSNHTVPVGAGVFSCANSAYDILTPTWQNNRVQLMTTHGAFQGAVYPTGVGHAGAYSIEKTFAAVAEEIDNELWLPEIGYVSYTVGVRGPKGNPFDMWWGQYQVANHGDTYPNDAANRDFVQMGCFVFPWTGDATVPLTA